MLTKWAIVPRLLRAAKEKKSYDGGQRKLFGFKRSLFKVSLQSRIHWMDRTLRLFKVFLWRAVNYLCHIYSFITMEKLLIHGKCLQVFDKFENNDRNFMTKYWLLVNFIPREFYYQQLIKYTKFSRTVWATIYNVVCGMCTREDSVQPMMACFPMWKVPPRFLYLCSKTSEKPGTGCVKVLPIVRVYTYPVR